MILTRDKGQRMWGGGGGSSYSYGGGGGGESPSFDGFVSNEYYNQNFELLYKQEVTVGGTTTTTFMTAAPNIIVPVGTVTDQTTQTTTVTSLVGPVAKNAIVLGNIMMVYDQTNNAIKVVNRDGSTAANFYATGGVSALGYSPGGGGGGGADLNLLLDSINESSIGDTPIGNDKIGKCLVYNGNNDWTWATPGGGGTGVDLSAVWSSIAGNTDAYANIKVNPSHIQGVSMAANTYGTYVAVKFPTDMTSEIAAATGNGWLEWWQGTNQWINHAMGHLILADGSAQIRTYGGTSFNLPSAAGTLALESQIPTVGLSDGEITIGSNTITPVTSVGLSMPIGFTVTNSPVTKTGTLQVSFTDGYSLPTTNKQSQWDTAYTNSHTHSNKSVIDGITSTMVSHWNTAYGWGNHATVGYLLKTEGMKFEARNGYVAARFVLADGNTYDSTRAALAQGSGFIEWWSTGGFFNHWMGNVIIGQDATDSTHYIQIGGGRICWDNGSKSLYVVQADGTTAANFYATGGVSALGISTGGTPSVSALTVGTLNASSQLNVGGTSSFTGAMTANAMTVNGNISSTNWQIPTTGYARFARLFLDDTRYVYVSNGHLYFNNGSSNIQIA